MQINRVALLGAGAVGSYFIWGLSGLRDLSFCLIAEGERKERLRQDGVQINGECYRPAVCTPQEAYGADLILVATKYDGLDEGIAQLAEATGPHTTIMSVMNGVDSAERIGERVGMEHMLHGLIKIASRRVGHAVTFSPEATYGIIFGEAGRPDVSERMQAVAELFDRGHLRYTMSSDILREQWQKYAFNISFNLPQAILNCGIGAYAASAHAAFLKQKLREEVAAVAAAVGIDISELSDIEKMRLPSAPDARYSTLQDLDAGRHTEIEMFSGTLIRMAEASGVAVPYNTFAYHAIKALEERNDGCF